MKPTLNMDKIAKGLKAERMGCVTAKSGYFGAHQVAAEVQARFRPPTSGGRSTDPSWTERRLVAFTPKTLAKLEELTVQVGLMANLKVEPLQLAAILVEVAAEQMGKEEAERLVKTHQS